MNTIIGNKIENVINVTINGRSHKRTYKTNEEAKEMYEAILAVNENETKESLDRVMFLLNKTTFTLKGDFLYFDDETETFYIKGVDGAIPDLLGETIDEYIREGYPIEALKSFATLLMSNPDDMVRQSLFDFIKKHDFSISNKGYMLTYKAVTHKKIIENDVATFVGKAVVIAKKYKKAPKVYCVYKKEDGELGMTLEVTFGRWVVNGKAADNALQLVGNLSELYNDIANIGGTVFTDKHSRTMNIQLGVPVKLESGLCDNNPDNECSKGLHLGATKYVENFGNSDDTILLCLVNPAHVVAVPNYDRSKMRVSEYYPYGIVDRDDKGKIKIVKQSYFESDYAVIEKKQLETAIVEASSENAPEVQAMKIRVLSLAD